MWEDQDEDDDEEEDGLAGQLLSDILATSKYGERRGQPCAHWYREQGAQERASGGPTRDVPWAFVPLDLSHVGAACPPGPVP